MSSDFWQRKLTGQPQQVQRPTLPGTGYTQAPATTEPAWWQAPQPISMQPVTAMSGDTVLDGGVTVQQLAQMDPRTLSQDALEVVARYKLNNPKYNNHCPYCQSTNYGSPGNSLGRQSNAASRCFDCGFQSGGIAARMDNQLQPQGKTAGKSDSQHINGGSGSFNGAYQHISQGGRYEAMGLRPGI